MKLAITMIPDTGRISPVFETAEHLLVIRLCCNGDHSVIGRETLPEDEAEKIAFLRSRRIRTLICGAVCNETLASLRSIGIRVIPFASGLWKSLLGAALDKTDCLPPDLIMPGCCGHHRRCCQNQGENANESCIDLSE